MKFDPNVEQQERTAKALHEARTDKKTGLLGPKASIGDIVLIAVGIGVLAFVMALAYFWG